MKFICFMGREPVMNTGLESGLLVKSLFLKLNFITAVWSYTIHRVIVNFYFFQGECPAKYVPRKWTARIVSIVTADIV